MRSNQSFFDSTGSSHTSLQKTHSISLGKSGANKLSSEPHIPFPDFRIAEFRNLLDHSDWCENPVSHTPAKRDPSSATFSCHKSADENNPNTHPVCGK
jgi:hypothetical protein